VGREVPRGFPAEVRDKIFAGLSAMAGRLG
jgi:hypothetical protein